MATEGASAKVQLWVYDLSGGMARQFSEMLLGEARPTEDGREGSGSGSGRRAAAPCL